jgi:hypothetical protein
VDFFGPIQRSGSRLVVVRSLTLQASSVTRLTRTRHDGIFVDDGGDWVLDVTNVVASKCRMLDDADKDGMRLECD